MRDELPIACSLSAPDLADRLAAIAALGADALLEAQHDGAHAELRFASSAAVRQRVEALVAAEARCCAFLRMRVQDTARGIVLGIDAPAGAEPVLREMVARSPRSSQSAPPLEG